MKTQKRSYEEVTRQETEVFKFHPLNRIVNDHHVKKLKAAMIENFYQFPPIIVNKETKRVIDGQQRLTAFRELVDEELIERYHKIGVQYVNIPEEDELKEIIQTQMLSRSWVLDDFIISHSKYIQDYQKLIDFCKVHVLCNDKGRNKYRYAAAMLKGVGCSKQLIEGTFSLTDEEIEKGDIIHDEILEILKVLEKPMKGNYFEYMSIAWFEVRDLHSFRVWLRGLRRCKNVLLSKPFENKKDWVDIFSKAHIKIDTENIR